MTTEPKFVPSNGANIKIEDFSCNVKLIDCVGYVIPNATGYEDENGNKRYKIEVCAEEFNFVNSKRKNNNENKAVME